MTIIFGEDRTAGRTPHIWCPTLAQWVADENHKFHAIGANIAADNRVNDARLAKMSVHRMPLKRALNSYLKRNIRQHAEFETAVNRQNSAQGIPEDEELVWLLDLTKMYTVPGFLEAVSQAPLQISDRKDAKEATAYFDSILGNIANHANPSNAHKVYLKRMLKEMGNARWTYHPVWVTLYSQFQWLLAEKPERWLEALGMRQHRTGRYIAAFKYKKNLRELFRPCCAEACGHVGHYATPTQVDPAHGGRAMDLTHQLRPGHDPLPEFIHRHGPWDDASTQVIGLGRTEHAVGGVGIVNYRKRHKLRLKQLWPTHRTLIDSWPD